MTGGWVDKRTGRHIHTYMTDRQTDRWDGWMDGHTDRQVER